MQPQLQSSAPRLRPAHRIHRPRRRRLPAPLLARRQARRHGRLRQAGDGLESGRSASRSTSQAARRQARSEAELPAAGGPRRPGALALPSRPTASCVLSGSEDNAIRLWDVASRRSRESRSAATAAPSARARSRPTASWSSPAATMQQCACGTSQATRKSACCTPPCSPGMTMPCSRPAIRTTASRSSPPAAIARPACGTPQSGERLRQFEEGHEFLASGAAFFPDGKHLATGAGDNSVRIWDLTAGTQVAVLTPTGRIGTLAVSPDGNWIATGSPGNDVQIWDAQVTAQLLGDADRPHRRSFRHRVFARRRTAGQRRRPRPRPLVASGRRRQPLDFERELAATAARSPRCASRPTASGSSRPAATTRAANGIVATGEEDRQLVLKHPEWVSVARPVGRRHAGRHHVRRRLARLWRSADAAARDGEVAGETVQLRSASRPTAADGDR